MASAVAVLPASPPAHHHRGPMRRMARVGFYEDTCVRPLATIDPTRTLLGVLCRRADDGAFNARVIATTRRLGPVMHALAVVYYTAVVAVFFHHDRAVRGVASHVSGTLGMVLLFYLLATLAWDMVRLLLSTFEFWFLFAINTANIALWHGVIIDERRIGLFAMGACYGASLLADANVYTRRLFMRTMAVGAALLSVVLALLTLRRLVGATYPTYRLLDIEVEAVDLLLTGSFIIAFFSTARVHRSRRLIFPSANATDQRVACEMYFPECQLVPQRAPLPATHTTKDPQVRAPLRPVSGPRPLRLVQSDVARGIDVHDVLLPAVANSVPLTPARRILLNLVGVVGIVCTTLSPSLRLLEISAGHLISPTNREYVALDLVGALATALFSFVYAAHAQRTLAKRVCLELDAWFVLLQSSVLAVGVSDALHWDAARAVFPWSIWLWCLWVLFLDAVPPVTRRALGLSRWLVLLATAFLLAHPLVLGYWLYLSPARRLLRNREVLRIPLGANAGGDLRLDVLGFLASKLFTHFVWMGRFFWRELLRPHDAFKLIKRRVFYEGDSSP